MSSCTPDLAQLAQSIKIWGQELGFAHVGIAGVDLGEHEHHLQRWLDAGYQGEMEYLGAHGSKRAHPEQLIPGTVRVVSLRMDYLPGDTQMAQRLAQPEKAYISRYALGRDYHKLVRKRVQFLADRIQEAIGPFGYRAFVDSAPVLEKALAEQAGLGWIGKNTLLLNRKAGSYFFLAELFVDLPLPVDEATTSEHCGRCQACLDICPTQAFVGPYVLDARRCISYLTIELKGAIPVELRSMMVTGCSVAMTARSSAHGTALPSTPRNRTSSRGMGWRMPSWRRCSCGMNAPSCARPRAGHCGGRGMSGSCATWRWGWAMRLPPSL